MLQEEQQPPTSQINKVVEGQKANDKVFKKIFVPIYFPFNFQCFWGRGYFLLPKA